MDESDLAPLFRKLTGALKPLASTTPGAMEQAGRAIALAMGSGQNEPLGAGAAAHALTEDELSLVRAALPEAQERGGIRVFRRQGPVITELAAESVPAWAAGQAIDQTFGPFLDSAGQRVWIDLWRFVAQTSIVNVSVELTG